MELNFTIIWVVLILVLIHYYITWKLKYWERKGVPTEKPVFLFGNALGMLKSWNLPYVMQPTYHKLKGKSSFFGFYMFLQPLMVLTDLDLIKNILIKDFQSFQDRGMFSNPEVDPISGNLLALTGNQWKNMRMKLTPTFTSGKMKMMHQTMVLVADQLKDYLTPLAEKKTVIEVKEVLAEFTTDIIGNVAFGIDVNSLSNPGNEFRRFGRRIIDDGPFFKLIFASMFPKLSKKIKFKVTNPDVEKFFINLATETLEYREKNNIQRNDFMSLLIQIRNTGTVDGENVDLGTLTIEEIAAQTFIFFAAGFETSSSTMTFALYELAQNPDIQERARQEVRDALERNNGVLNYEATSNLTYLGKVIDETLRKYPIAIDLFRRTTTDYKVPNTNVVIEKNIPVMVPVFVIHRDPEIYPDPDKFDPERFTPENIQARHPCAYLPFGEGPRNCIGMRFGLMQTKIGLATILNSFKISPTIDTPNSIKFNARSPLLSPVGGMHLKIEKCI